MDLFQHPDVASISGSTRRYPECHTTSHRIRETEIVLPGCCRERVGVFSSCRITTVLGSDKLFDCILDNDIVCNFDSYEQ